VASVLLGLLHCTLCVRAGGFLNSTAECGIKSLFLGSNALAIAEHEKPMLIHRDFDYGNKLGAAIGNIWGLQKVKYNGEDMGVIAVKTYRTAL